MRKIPKELKLLRELWGGFRASRVLITANNLGVFERLSTEKDAGQVARLISADRRATEILLDALTGLGLLKKKNGRYINSKVSEMFLVRKSPYYQGDIIRHADSLWKNWSGLDEVVRSGRPNRASHDHESFIRGMHNIAALKAGSVLDAIGLRGVRRALDLGGGPGTYSIEMARRGIEATIFDLPDTIKIAKDIVRKSKVNGVKFISGDFLNSDIGGGYDMVFISQILHSLSIDDSKYLLKKASASLNPKGRIVIQEFYINRERTSPMDSALFSVNMLVNTEGGRCYTSQEIKSWLKEIGLRAISERLLGDVVLIMGSLP